MVAAGAGADMAHVHDDVEALVDAVEISLVAPQLEAFAGNALEERGEGGDHVDLRFVRTHREAVGHEQGGLFLDTQFDLVLLGQLRGGLAELGRRVEVAAHDEGVVRMRLGHGGVTGLGPGAGAGLFTGLRKGDFGQLLGVESEVGRAGSGTGVGGYFGLGRPGNFVKRSLLGLVAGEHHIAQHLGLVAALHVAVVVIDAAGQVVHEQHTLEHRHDISVAHQ